MLRQDGHDPTSLSDSCQEQRDRLLLQYAISKGCNRLAMGYSSTRLAVQVIAQAAKGRGLDIPASIHHLGPRWALSMVCF